MKHAVSLSSIIVPVAFALFMAQAAASDKPILLVGASFVNGNVPFNEGLSSPLGGSAVAAGSYLSLGDALIGKGVYVINEAQAGGGTLQRISCGPTPGTCVSGYWDSYITQLDRAILRVAVPNAPLNADYVVIDVANDCLHGNDRGLPWSQTAPCTPLELVQYVDRLIAVGQEALNNGLTPIYTGIPHWDDAGLQLFAQLFGFPWVIDEATVNQLRSILIAKLNAELPQAIYVDAWDDFEDLGDGLHPTPEVAEKAAERILDAITEYESQ